MVPLSHENANWKPAATSGADGSVTLVAEKLNGVGPSATELGAVTPVTVGATLFTVTEVITGSLSASSLSFAFTATFTVPGPSGAAHVPELVAEKLVHVEPLLHENAYSKPVAWSTADGSVTPEAEKLNDGPSLTEDGAVTPVTVGFRLLTVTDFLTGALSPLSLSFAFTATFTVPGPSGAAHEPALVVE